ncbi:hypothetical protein FDP41_000697 [Naegleria fowleri]|uniref:Uncharacterized protein n=1 Tax=Naegleria fowleri TaxID=5763 RepID=A0A6A5CHT4_NAEFO|nr:uncharacterized protein FDP41_000697 [Naegleria fowleri]KAF0984798.1 hypothetical protein FDP41_000697 [Naegleria fowleri]CAG4715364.1 unnamed protein product [Naegleria fowleri]
MISSKPSSLSENTANASSNNLWSTSNKQELFDLIWQNKNHYYEHLSHSNDREGMEGKNPCIISESKPSYFLSLGMDPYSDNGKVMTFYNQVHFHPTQFPNVEDLDRIKKYAKEAHVPLLASLPYYTSPNVEQRLEELFQNGFFMMTKSPGMICSLNTNLDHESSTAGETKFNDLQIGELKRNEDETSENNILLREWCNVLVSSFGFFSKKSTIEHFYHLFRNCKYGPNEKLRMFYVTHQESPQSQPIMISVASLFIEPEKHVCGLYNVATLPNPQLRRKGTARLLSRYVVYEIGKKQLGLKYCTLQSSKAAYNLYKQLGFVHVGDWSHAVSPDHAHWSIQLLMNIVLLRFFMKITGIRDLTQKSNWYK